ncbi:MAG: Spy/CpxP family protein refolding chaperone [Myxococcales bacterium]|nr:Spy/CpxP family protein refolding chaperone [Myxococcales bacterium]
MALVPVACSQTEQAPESKEQKQEVSQPAETSKAFDRKAGKLGKLGKLGKHGKFGRRDKGPAQLLLKTALSELELSEDQKETITALKQEKQDAKRDPKSREAMKTAMIEAAKAGKVDEKAFDEKIASMKEHQQARTAAQTKLLNGLYAALTPEQRTELVTKVKAEMESRRKHREEMAAKWAERAKDDDAKTGPHRGMKGMKGMKGMHGGPFGMMTRGLELTEDQQTKLDALKEKGKADMPSPEDMKSLRAEMDKKMDELLDAFAKDGFDASKFNLSPKHKDMGEMMKKQVAHMNEFLAILTPEQRTKLAEQIEKGPRMRKGRGLERGADLRRARPGADDGQDVDDVDDLLGDDLDQGLDDIEDEVMGDDQAAE